MMLIRGSLEYMVRRLKSKLFEQERTIRELNEQNQLLRGRVAEMEFTLNRKNSVALNYGDDRG